MPVIPELRDLVELLGEYDESYQRWAIRHVLTVVNQAEQDVADSSLSREERCEVRLERIMLFIERYGGKAAAEEARAKIEEVRRLFDDES